MATTLETLLKQLEQEKPYQPLKQQEMDEQAKRRYQSVYDQKRLDAKQAYETADAALARELAGLSDQFDRQKANAEAQTRSAASQTDRHALSRGMQRSSYNEANLTGIRLAGDAAQRDLDREQAKQEQAIGEKRTQLGMQLSETLAQLNASQKNDELAYADELKNREADRAAQHSDTMRDLALQLYEYRHQLEQEAAEQERWQAEFNARYGQPASAGARKTAPSPALTAAKAALGGSLVR